MKTQEKKQTNETEEHGKQLVQSNALIKKYDYDTEEDSPTLLKQREIPNTIIDEKHDKML